MSLLENRDELSDQDILDAIDELVLAEGRELRLSLRAKEEFRRELFCSVRKLDVIQELVDDPVSYTHLDVYKRQPRSRVRQVFWWPG